MPNYRDGPGYRDMREPPGDRLFVAPHVGMPHGQPIFMMPSHALTLGKTTLGKGDFYHPTVTLFAMSSPAALVFIPTADELEALSEAMAKEAARMREDAAKLAADLIDRAQRG